MTNLALAEELLRDLARLGVSEIVLCAGARNSPLVALLGRATGFKVYSFFEERSAGFFALGRMQAERKPVVVCTTSGTAVAELLPAVIEADYQSLPLIVLSADRPRSYRGTGAPQTIVQPGIFSAYVEKSWDFEKSLEPLVIGHRPIHVNVCFDEPLIDGPLKDISFDPKRYAVPFSEAPLKKKERRTFLKPLVIVGGLEPASANEIEPILARWNRPVYLEAMSQLRGRSSLKHLEIVGGEALCKAGDFDGVIRIGTVPTLRFWRDLAAGQLPVVHFSQRPWSGLPGPQDVHDLSELSAVAYDFKPWAADERERDRQRFHQLEKLIREYPLSECAWVRRLSEWMPNGSRVFLGNSLPIREWDLAARRDGDFSIFANRGVNGIDGLISTFIGVAGEDTGNWGVIGDLSALYDLSGPWALRQRPLKDFHLAVINNGGGKIFERIFGHPLFENRHDLNFNAWSKMWNLNYQRFEAESSSAVAANSGVLEIFPNAKQTADFYKKWESIKC